MLVSFSIGIGAGDWTFKRRSIAMGLYCKYIPIKYCGLQQWSFLTADHDHPLPIHLHGRTPLLQSKHHPQTPQLLTK